MKTHFLEALSEMVQKSNSTPTAISVNPDWLDQQIKVGNLLKRNSDTDLSVLNKIPVHLNREMKTYKFHYH